MKARLNYQDNLDIGAVKAQLEAFRLTGLLSCLEAALEIARELSWRIYAEGRFSKPDSGNVPVDDANRGGQGS